MSESTVLTEELQRLVAFFEILIEIEQRLNDSDNACAIVNT